MKPLEAKAVTDRLTGTPADPQDRPQQAAMPSVISLHVHLPSSPSSGFAENIKPPVKKAKKPPHFTTMPNRRGRKPKVTTLPARPKDVPRYKEL